MTDKKNLEKKKRRIIPWYEELVVGTIMNVPYAVAATTAAVVAEQFTATQSTLADLALAIPTVTTLVTLDALVGRFTEENEPVQDKIEKGIIAGIAAAGACNFIYETIGLTTADAEQAAYGFAGTMLGYLAVKGIKDARATIGYTALKAIDLGFKAGELVKQQKRTAAVLAATAGLIFPVLTFINYVPQQEITKTEVVSKSASDVKNITEPDSVAEVKTKVSYGASPPFMIWPVANPKHEVIACFGYRGYGVANGFGTVYHPGLDIEAKFGTPVLAVADGTVVAVDARPWGIVSVYHGNHRNTTYLHMSRIEVNKGQKVVAGQEIGQVGTSAPYPIGAHLHFEIQDGNIDRDQLRNKVDVHAIIAGRNVNPLCYLDTLTLNPVILDNLSSQSQGGWDKFCEDYTRYTKTPAALDVTINMLSEIEKRYHDEISAGIIGTPINPYMLVSMIKVESGGLQDKHSAGKPYTGIFQLSRDLGVKYNLCDNNICSGRDDRSDPKKETRAAAEHLGLDLMHRFLERYTWMADELTLAAYNAGTALVQAALMKTEIELRKQSDGSFHRENITWKDVSDNIDADLVCKAEGWRSRAKCAQKAERIKDYVNDIMWYQSLLLDDQLAKPSQ